MSKSLETSENKIQAICKELKENTLIPAKKQAEQIIIEAEHRAEAILKEAYQKSEEILQGARKKIEHEKKGFEIGLQQAAKQAVESLKQWIENEFFHPELLEQVQKETKEEKWIAKVLEAMVEAIERKGFDANLEAVVAKEVNPKSIHVLLGKKTLEKLKNGAVRVGEFRGGAEVKISDKNITLMMTDQAIAALLAPFLRKDFRELFFNECSLRSR